MSSHIRYIAVHGGAGSHRRNQEDETKQALRRACQQALKECANIGDSSRPDVKEDTTSLDMVVDSITILENDPCLNAGYGSNLTLSGTVECDAALMDGYSGDFGSVGAVSGIKNPIRLARAVLENSKIPDPLGRVPPLFVNILSTRRGSSSVGTSFDRTLVSEGAHSFARSNTVWQTVETVEPDSLISMRASENWSKWKVRLENPQAHPPSIGDVQDTVGAVAYRTAGVVAAGVSSGGILLKHPGRIGEAATFGAGCWAQHFARAGLQIACSISGTGEYISRTMLARVIMDYFRMEIERSADVDCHDILQRALLVGFHTPCRERGVNSPHVGVLLLVAQETPATTHVRLFCGFTTPSMAIGYASSKNPRPKIHILRRSSTTSARADEPHMFITAITMPG